MDAATLKVAKNYTNEQAAQKATNSPVEEISFDGGIYSVGNNVVNGQVSDVLIKGLTASNIIKNGNFANGTADWLANNSTLSASNNTLNVTGNGTASNPRTYTYPSSLRGDYSYFVKLKVRVTNADCSAISVYLSGNVSTANLQTISNPVQNQWYTVYVKDTETFAGVWQIYVAHTYVGAATANGKVMEVQEVSIINMTAEGLEDLTADEMNAKFPHWLDGTKSTDSVRVKSVGKNLLKKLESLSDFISPIQSNINVFFETDKLVITTPSTFRVLHVNPIRVKPNTSYRFGIDGYGSAGYRRVEICDRINGTVLGYTNLIEERDIRRGGFNSGSNEQVYIRFYITGSASVIPGDMHIYSIQLEEGSTHTEHEPYKESIVNVNLPEPLRSLPNGTKDEVNVTSGLKTQRIGVKTNVASDTVINYADMATGGQFVAYYADGTQQIGVEGDTLTALATTLIYQLATPIVTKLPAQAPLQVFENGTVYVEPIGDASESTLPSVEMTIPTGTSNKFGVASHDYDGAAADWVLTNSESKCFLLAVSSAGDAANIIAPDAPGAMYAISNASGQMVTVKISGGTGVAITNAKTVLVIHNGTDYTALTAEL